MNTAIQLEHALENVNSAIRGYKDYSIMELIETGEITTYYRLKEDKVLLLKALESFGDFLARRDCQIKIEEAENALVWLNRLKGELK